MHPHRYALPLTLVVLAAALLLFWRISSRGINEWDEARNGVNAYEMYRSGDPVNLYYAGALDTWNAKPPLVIWMISGCYALFGPNCFSLRFPSALCTIGFFIFIFLLIARSSDRRLALLTSCILLSCKAAISIHLGLTGDFDAPLLFFLAASAYYFLRFFQEGNRLAIYLAALFTGLAWYAKGPAGLIYLPGCFLFATIMSGNLKWLKNRHVLLAGLFAFLIVLSWIIIVALYGKTSGLNHYAPGNAIRTLLVEDTWHRLTSSRFEGGQPADYFFFFEAIDVRLNLWNYLFYLSIALGLYKAWRQKGAFFARLRDDQDGLMLFALCILVPPALLLNFAAYKYNWYLAPVFWPVALITARGILYLSRKFRWVLPAAMLLVVFGYARQLLEVNQSADNAVTVPRSLFANVDSIVVIGGIHQDIYLQLAWSGKPVFSRQLAEVSRAANTLVVADTSMAGIKDLGSHLWRSTVGSYCIGRWK